jgi:hypothetical protein
MSVKSFVSVAAIVAVSGLGASVASGQTYQFDYSGAIVNWVVPTSGIYRVTAVGGQGGGVTTENAFYGVNTAEGGRGARVAGTVTLNAGTTLQIAVAGGGALGGSFAPNFFGGGGGGGSFVVAPGDTPLIVAGGGGGASYMAGIYSPNDNLFVPPAVRQGQDAQLTELGGADFAQTTSVGLGGRASRFLNMGATWSGDATGGAGFYGDSRDLLNPSHGYLAPPVSASAWPSLLPVSGGGFGGGGGGFAGSSLDFEAPSWFVGLGAGGGGYTGGGGGLIVFFEDAGFQVLRSGYGGGSFASSLATDTFLEVASDRTGNGVVTIEFLAVPGPSGAVVVVIGGVMAGRRRR